MELLHGVPAMVPVVEVEEAEEGHLQDERSPNLLLDSAHFLNLCPQIFGPCSVFHLDVEVALAACFDLHEVDPLLLMMDRVTLAAVDHLLLFHDVEQAVDRTGTEILLDSFQHLKIFSSRREISVPANRVSARTAEPAVEQYSVLAVAYDHFDTACAEHGTVSAHELAAAVHCAEVYFLVASEPAVDPETATSVAVVALDITTGRFAGEALASAEGY